MEENIKILPKYNVKTVNSTTLRRKHSNKKKTTEEYKQEINNINPSIIVLEEYINARTRILHKCLICNHSFMIEPMRISPNYECPNCKHLNIIAKNNEKYLLTHKQKIREKFKDYIVVLSDTYVVGESLTYKCLRCQNVWSKKPYDILKSKGCPKCTSKLVEKNKRISFEEFSKQINLDKIMIFKETYVSTNDPVTCKCTACDYIWVVNQANSLRYYKNGCPQCANNIKLTNNDFLKRYSNSINNNIELLENYTSAATPILCKCKMCGHLSYKMPKHIISGQGCKKCASIIIGKKLLLSQKEFEEKIKDRHPTLKILSEYLGYYKKVSCICSDCSSKWETTPSSLFNSIGCPFCQMTTGEQLIKNYLKTSNNQYIYQYTYNDLRGINDGLLSYDFFILNYNILIEFQGRQHEEPVDFFGGKKSFIKQQIHDIRKRKYAKEHNIKLITIWYNQVDKIPEILNNYLNNLKLESVTTTGVA